jgi:ABC-type multidrug transport system fused ATPase/permease subunit
LDSHLVSPMRNSDRIVVLAKGEIAEQRTHAALLVMGGLPAESVRQQQLEGKLEQL